MSDVCSFYTSLTYLFAIDTTESEHFLYGSVEGVEDAMEWQKVSRTITITEIDDAEAEAWIRANARKLSTLYSRENGEWVSKGEI